MRVFTLLFIIFLNIPLLASSTKEETKALVQEAAAYCKAHTQKECFDAINSNKFIKNELFIFAFDYDGVGVANGKIPQLIGKNLWYLRNQDGLNIFQEQINIAKKSQGWLQYKWKTPNGKSIEKLSYIMDINNKFYIGSGLTLQQIEVK